MLLVLVYNIMVKFLGRIEVLIVKMKKIICVICSILCLLFTQVLTVSANTYSEYSGKRIISITEEQLFNSIWEYQLYVTIPDEELETGETVVASVKHYELKKFLSDYEPINRDVTVSDVSNDFTEWLDDKYSKAGTTIEKDDNNNYYEYKIDNPDEKFYYSYDEATDQYICKDTDGKIMKTYPKYHYEPEDSASSSVTDSNSSSAKPNNGGNYNNSQSSAYAEAETTIVEAETAIVEAEIATAEQDATIQTDDGMSGTQITILIVLGVLVAIGAVVVVVMIIKKRDKDKVN